MNLLKISRGALEVREANSPLTEGELHLNTVFNKKCPYEKIIHKGKRKNFIKTKLFKTLIIL